MILVTGATGLVGGHLLGQICRGGAAVRALVRSPERADALRGYDCETAVGDFGDPESLLEAVRGVDAVFLVSPSSPDLPRHEGAVLDAVAATDRPVRVVKVAVTSIDRGTGRIADAHQQVVDRLRADGTPHTVLAPGMFAQNLLALAAPVQEQGVLPVPAGEARVAHVDARDVAAVGAHVLTSEGHDGAVYRITGPEALRYDEVAERLSAVAGREVRYVDVPPESWRAEALASGVPEWNVDGLLEVYAALRQGPGDVVTDEVEKATGSPARRLDEFLADHRAAFAAAGA